MTDEQDQAELTEEELERQRAEQLPDREVMSMIQPHPPLPTVEPGGYMPPDGYEPQPPPEVAE